MALTLNVASRSCSVLKLIEEKLRLLSVSTTFQRESHYQKRPKPRLRNPSWLTPKARTIGEENLTQENRDFLAEIVDDKLKQCTEKSKQIVTSPVPWTPKLQRTGVIAKKIGIYPLWLKNGTRIQTTLLQVLDNHVIRYYTPEEYEPVQQLRPRVYNKKGCLLVGAELGDPSTFTREYCGLFKESGVLPTKLLGRFFVSPDASLPQGTTINAQHFQVGNYVDVRGKTIDRGFQGVMKRHGFKGMPASHGVTKSHRRVGNIGAGGEKARVWPGKKMPGHMGNRFKMAKALKIWRINTKYNVLWVSGQAIPGETNSIVYVYDTQLPTKTPQKPLPFPTFFENENETAPEDIFDEEVHSFADSTILFDEK
ncbi:hypothetical protein HUJ04_002338 [Dendroctonus ponderosae]